MRSVLIPALCGLSLTTGVSATSHNESMFYSQDINEGFNVLKHHGGTGPYSQRRSFGVSRDTPASCAVDQVIMIHRHGARYPDPNLGKGIEKTLDKMRKSGSKWKDELAFFDTWKYFVTDKCLYNAETSNGSYAGLTDAHNHGEAYRARYGHLWDGKSVVPMFTAGFSRVIRTARSFGKGFFGDKYSTRAALNIISESSHQGVNSLTPSCDKGDDKSTCHKLTNVMPQFEIAAARLNDQYPDLKLTAKDIFYLMSMASFELNARGSSKWVDVFTRDEWVSFGYVGDLNFYYCSGPGNKNMAAVGSVYANASLSLLNQGPKKAGSIFFNFAHDSNITPILAALRILIPDEDLPLDRIPFGNPYTLADIVPQGGHFTIERLACNSTAISDKGTYVRLVLNEAVVPFNKCTSGPGYSCPLSNYTSIVSDNLPDYKSSCKVPSSYPQALDFWWSYNTTTGFNHEKKPAACQEAEVME